MTNDEIILKVMEMQNEILLLQQALSDSAMQDPTPLPVADLPGPQEWVQPEARTDGTTTNDIEYWNESSGQWLRLAAPATSGNFYLKVESGTLKWQAAGSCS